MIKTIIHDNYGICVNSYKKLSVGAGSDTYILYTDKGKLVLKNPSESSINNPQLEPQLCSFLLSKGIPACQFIPTISGELLCCCNNELYQLQKFVEGINYQLNTVPWNIMLASAAMLGRIHTALKDYKGLPIGIGEGFFKNMTPERAIKSYEATLKTAEKLQDSQVIEDLRYRLKLMEEFPIKSIDINSLTCGSTHGDYFISQLICNDNGINAVIDWTCACIHPLVWEIIRSFVYGEPSCIEGEINAEKLILYIQEYLKHAKLSKRDILEMPRLFFYQIAVCDYYGQYYSSKASNRYIYLHQAKFSTKLMKWFEKNIDSLTLMLDKSF